MGETSRVFLLRAASREPIEAELSDAIEPHHLVDVQTTWAKARSEIQADLIARGVHQAQWPQSLGWDWCRVHSKVGSLLGFRGFAVRCEGTTQGLMFVNLLHAARFGEHAGKPLVYVELIESAPWNWPLAGRPLPTFRGVGSVLFTAAVALSQQEGFKGRVGLHSLPQSQPFYRDTLALHDLGPDVKKQNLRYFELTAEQARDFLGSDDA